jgi:ATP-dependent DNA ligase
MGDRQPLRGRTASLTVWVVEWGGEGIVLKQCRSAYKPGCPSRCWWKAKNKMTLSVDVLQ